MASTRKRWMLTETNLRRLQPSLIQPMPPVSISSGDDEGDEDPAVDAVIAREAPAARVARLRTWVYNAMLTLVGLGDEGVQILAADELCIAGPGDVRLRTELQKQNTARLKQAKHEGHDDEDENEDDDDAEEEPEEKNNKQSQNPEETEARDGPDLSDPAYWQAKLRYLEAKCKPLSQERRKRRRLAPESQIAAEDAARADAEARAAEGGGYVYQNVPAVVSEQQLQRQREEVQAREEARAERARVEQSKLLWRDKRSSIERWVQALPPLPLAGGAIRYFWGTDASPEDFDPYPDSGAHRPPIINPAALSDSSIMEITPAQFTNTHPPQQGGDVDVHGQQQPPHTLTVVTRLGGGGLKGLQALHAPVVGIGPAMNTEMVMAVEAAAAATAAAVQPHQQQNPLAMADASLDLSAATAATAPQTAATPATFAMGTPNTSASPGEGPHGEDVVAPPAAAVWTRTSTLEKLESSGHHKTAAVLGKRRRGGAVNDVDGRA